MSFQNNNKLGRGGARAGAGRPTREETEFKAAVADAVGMEMKRLAEKLAKRLGARALVDDRVPDVGHRSGHSKGETRSRSFGC
jgi:hypothetical protein